MNDPATLPVVVDIGVDRLVLVVNRLRKHLADAVILRNRNVRSFIEHEAFAYVRGCMTATVALGFVDDVLRMFSASSCRGPKSAHARSKNRQPRWHCYFLAPWNPLPR